VQYISLAQSINIHVPAALPPAQQCKLSMETAYVVWQR